MTELSKKTKNKIKRKVKKDVKSASKKLSFGGSIAILLCFGIAVVGGIFAERIITKNDCFVLSGDKEIVLDVEKDSTYTYVDQGYKVISFGKDISSKVEIKTNMNKADDGSYTIDLSTEGDYYMIYTVDSPKYGKIKRVRTFTVGADNE